MTISASLVKELRERTGAGMMECKKALQETNGDLDAAIEHMRKTGLAKADKKADRVAAEGRIDIATEGGRAAMVEINCETDFVAGGDDFKSFSARVTGLVLAESPADPAALSELPLDGGETVEEARRALIAKIGENITIRRFQVFAGDADVIGHYLHGTRIGVVVEMKGGSEELARDIAMHVAASRPVCVAAEQVPAEMLEKEREIIRAQAQDSGKPAEIVEKMVEGRMRKYLGEVTLLGQPFVKDPDQTVEKLLKGAGAEVLAFARYEVGEGIEKQEGNFAEEVMAQVRGS
ncbi:MAG: translation elongation factor Ts [Gammaproteobacteria bacterium]|jgi:elongation factor Ts